MVKSRFSGQFIIGCVFLVLVVVVQSDESCNLDFEKTLITLFTPQEQPSIQIRSLRRYMLSLLQSMVVKAEEIEGWNGYNYPKRNLEALARAGYLHTLPDEEENQTQIHEKRSFSSLVKNGQLPIRHYESDDGNKRSVQGMDQLDNELKREVQRMLEDLYENIENPQNYPSKRNIASIARDGGIGRKRNAAALLKNDRYLNQMTDNGYEDKRNIASVKASGFKVKNKKQIDYNGDDNMDYPVYSNSVGEESLVDELMNGERNQKRFLGSIAKSGWYDSPRTYSFGRSDGRAPPGKRHIGSLARLGWLPTIRSVRRFSRSGRSSNGITCIRETSPNGQDQNYYVSENSIPLDDKRFLPVPALWKVPLQTVNY